MAAGFKVAGTVLLIALALALDAGQAGAKTTGCSGALLDASSESFPVELPGSLEAPILASYAVFRRPQQPSDQLPPVNTAGPELEGELSGYYAPEIRLVGSLPDGRRFFVIPGLPRVLKVPPLKCFPKGLRKRIAKIVEEGQKRQTEPTYCVIETGPRQGLSSGDCGAFAEVASSQRLFSSSLFRPKTTALLVPDGVASVRVTGPGKRQATFPVSENAYLYVVPHDLVVEQRRLVNHLFSRKLPKHPTKAQRQRLYRLLDQAFRTIALKTEPSKVEWLASGGGLVKSISRPKGGAELVGLPISTG